MVIERAFDVAGQQPAPPRWLAEWATDHFGLVSVAKLTAMGVSPQQRRTMLAEGRLLATPHRGIYRVGHAAHVPGQREALALAASSPRAALSGWSSAGRLGLCDPPPGVVLLVDPDRKSGRIPGARRIRGTLGDEEVLQVAGLRCTGVHRTLLDLPAHAPREVLRHALTTGLRRGHDLTSLHTACAGRRGARLLVEELELLFPELAATLSELEARFLRLLKRHGIELPQVNVAHGLRLLDCRWPGTMLVVELDGRRWHEHRFQQDRERDNAHVLLGLRTLRFTWQDLVHRSEEVAAQVRQAVAA